jgi:hypothetical protein
MGLFSKKEEAHAPAPDPNMVKVRPELTCCATCLWWMGRRNYVKQTEQITETKKGRTDTFIRVHRNDTGDCGNVKMDDRYGKPFKATHYCDGYQSWFVNGLPTGNSRL